MGVVVLQHPRWQVIGYPSRIAILALAGHFWLHLRLQLEQDSVAWLSVLLAPLPRLYDPRQAGLRRGGGLVLAGSIRDGLLLGGEHGRGGVLVAKGPGLVGQLEALMAHRMVGAPGGRHGRVVVVVGMGMGRRLELLLEQRHPLRVHRQLGHGSPARRPGWRRLGSGFPQQALPLAGGQVTGGIRDERYPGALVDPLLIDDDGVATGLRRRASRRRSGPAGGMGGRMVQSLQVVSGGGRRRIWWVGRCSGPVA